MITTRTTKKRKCDARENKKPHKKKRTHTPTTV
jgi:hypothetical protein